MNNIKEVALRVAREMEADPAWDDKTDDECTVEYVTRCLAELSKDAEPLLVLTANDDLGATMRFTESFTWKPGVSLKLYTRPQTIEAAVLQEREACAKVCDEYDAHAKTEEGWVNLAAAIRARNSK